MKERYDDLDEYIADLKKEIEANAQCATHYYNLGLALLSKRDFVAAEEALLNAVRNSPHLAEAYVQLGGICLERGDLEGCLHYNEEAANCRAKFPIPWSNIAFVHLQRGEPDKAIAALRKALKWDPKFIQAKNALGHGLLHEGRLQGQRGSLPGTAGPGSRVLPRPGTIWPWLSLTSRNTIRPWKPRTRRANWASRCRRAFWRS